MSKRTFDVHAEIEYIREDGMSIHSDICPPEHSSEGLSDVEWRKFLHDNLDEWLDKSNGTGGFYIKEEEHFFFPEPDQEQEQLKRRDEIIKDFTKDHKGKLT